MAALSPPKSLLDDLARKLDIDPLALRQKNAARNGTKTHYGPSHQNIGFETVLATVKSHPHWKSPVKPGASSIILVSSIIAVRLLRICR
jgi:CO/xanthine dehydrogenase Mo-binding subunit